MKKTNIDQEFDLTRLVKLYYHFHKKCISIQAYSLTKKAYRLYVHTETSEQILFKNVIFKVYESGRQRVLKEKVKNVHAYVFGYLSTPPKEYSIVGSIYYDPYKQSQFTVNQEPILKADNLLLKNNRLHVVTF